MKTVPPTLEGESSSIQLSKRGWGRGKGNEVRFRQTRTLDETLENALVHRNEKTYFLLVYLKQRKQGQVRRRIDCRESNHHGIYFKVFVYSSDNQILIFIRFVTFVHIYEK